MMATALPIGNSKPGADQSRQCIAHAAPVAAADKGQWAVGREDRPGPNLVAAGVQNDRRFAVDPFPELYDGAPEMQATVRARSCELPHSFLPFVKVSAVIPGPDRNLPVAVQLVDKQVERLSAHQRPKARRG